MDCTIRVARTKALISFADTLKLSCVFVFAYAKSRFSHDEAQIVLLSPNCNYLTANEMGKKLKMLQISYIDGGMTLHNLRYG